MTHLTGGYQLGHASGPTNIVRNAIHEDFLCRRTEWFEPLNTGVYFKSFRRLRVQIVSIDQT